MLQHKIIYIFLLIDHVPLVCEILLEKWFLLSPCSQK